MTALPAATWRSNLEILTPWIGTIISYGQLCKIFGIEVRSAFLGPNANMVGDSKRDQLIKLGLVVKVQGHDDEDGEEWIPSGYLITGGNAARERWLDELLASH